ncbi:MAG: response regulator [Rhodocyclaceae bacterium]|nr:response regulator [Rhodocyclaceae bacterium]
MVRMLRAAGLDVETAGNGHRAVELACQGPYALILIDATMPRLSGGEASRVIRRLPGHSATPILAMTSGSHRLGEQWLDIEGMDGHIAKPLRAETLYPLLLKWLPQADGLHRTAGPGVSAQTVARLGGVVDLDVVAGCARARGRGRIYVNRVVRFAREGSPNADALASSLADADTPRAARLARGMKAAAGRIGAAEVRAASARLETALLTRAKATEVGAAAADLRASLSSLLAALAPILPGLGSPLPRRRRLSEPNR